MQNIFKKKQKHLTLLNVNEMKSFNEVQKSNMKTAFNGSPITWLCEKL